MAKAFWCKTVALCLAIVCVLFAFFACAKAEDTPSEGNADTLSETPAGGSEQSTTDTEQSDENTEDENETEDVGEGEDGTDGDGTDEQSSGEDNTSGEAGAGDDTSDEEEEEDISDSEDVESYMLYLYENDRLTYYRVGAAAGLFDLLEVDMFDLSTLDEEGMRRYSDTQAIAGEYALIATGSVDPVARIRIAAAGTAEIYDGQNSRSVALYGKYDKEVDIVTVSDMTIGLSTDLTEGHLLYYVQSEDLSCKIRVRTELGVVQIDQAKSTVAEWLTEEEKEEDNQEEQNNEKGDSAEESSDTESNDPEETTVTVEDQRSLLSTSKCYAVLEDMGGVASVASNYSIGREAEIYTITFCNMTQKEWDAALTVWRAMTVSMDSEKLLQVSKRIGDMGYSFIVHLSESPSSRTMQVEVQGYLLS